MIFTSPEQTREYARLLPRPSSLHPNGRYEVLLGDGCAQIGADMNVWLERSDDTNEVTWWLQAPDTDQVCTITEWHWVGNTPCTQNDAGVCDGRGRVICACSTPQKSALQNQAGPRCRPNGFTRAFWWPEQRLRGQQRNIENASERQTRFAESLRGARREGQACRSLAAGHRTRSNTA